GAAPCPGGWAASPAAGAGAAGTGAGAAATGAAATGAAGSAEAGAEAAGAPVPGRGAWAWTAPPSNAQHSSPVPSARWQFTRVEPNLLGCIYRDPFGWRTADAPARNAQHMRPPAAC